MSYFFEAMQSYCSSVIGIILFTIIVIRNMLFSRDIKRLFIVENGLILLIILATWADRCFSNMYLGGHAWQLRSVTTCINFAVSPIASFVFVTIYRRTEHLRNVFYTIPAIVNVVLSIASIWTGWVFNINSYNEYARGPLFALPFIVVFFYLFSHLFTVNRFLRPYRKMELFVLCVFMVAVGAASALEIIFYKRFMIWSTSFIITVLYYLFLSMQIVIYDSLSGVYSRTVYDKMVETIERGNMRYSVAMIDINNLKTVNDSFGHCEGDRKISRVAEMLLKDKSRATKIYRFGGDEFVILSREGIESIESYLDKVQAKYTLKDEIPPFAYGIAEYNPGDAFCDVFEEADALMYKKKNIMHEKTA